MGCKNAAIPIQGDVLLIMSHTNQIGIRGDVHNGDAGHWVMLIPFTEEYLRVH
jgi:hypothetical protein